jgi:hypothetical protein
MRPIQATEVAGGSFQKASYWSNVKLLVTGQVRKNSPLGEISCYEGDLQYTVNASQSGKKALIY